MSQSVMGYDICHRVVTWSYNIEKIIEGSRVNDII